MKKLCYLCGIEKDLETYFYYNKSSKIHFKRCISCCKKQSLILRYNKQKEKSDFINLDPLIWKKHKSGLYVSKKGDVYRPFEKSKNRLYKAKMSKKTLMNSGYYTVCFNGLRLYIHRIVLETFKDINDSKQYYVNHKNRDRLDNCLDNLEWCTHKENIQHAIINDSYKVKLNREDVFFIRESNLSVRELAKKFNVSKTNIKLVIKRKIWKHI